MVDESSDIDGNEGNKSDYISSDDPVDRWGQGWIYKKKE